MKRSTSISPRIYAISHGGFIEFRSAISPPKRLVSKLVKKTRYKTILLEQASYVGGKFIGACPTTRFMKKAGFCLMNRQMAIVDLSIRNACLR